MTRTAELADPRATDRVEPAPKHRALVGRKHPALHTPAQLIPIITADIKYLAEQMLATCRVHRGTAIAAPQVGEPVRMVVGSDGLVLINPIVTPGAVTNFGVEECLSLPGRRYRVERAVQVNVTGMTLMGGNATFEATGDLARMWAHELDHLDGILISDRWPEVHA